MANLHLVTGYAGAAHVTAADDGSFNRAIFGDGQFVFDFGSKFAASVVSNNKITIADGDLLMQGRHVRLNEGTTVDLTITNGAQGKLRNDLIVARYAKDSVSGVEQVDLVVIQGTAVDSDPADPAYTSGDIINDHDLLNDMPLYRVPLDGLNVGTPVALFELASIQISDGAVTTDKLASDLLVPLANGGTGNTAGLAQTAIKLETARTIQTKLNSTSAVSFDGTGNVTPGVTGVLPLANGGTGQTTAQGIRNALGLGNTTGALPIGNGGTGANNKETALKNLNGISIKLLWQNASPTNSFASQQVSISFSGYSNVLVLAYVKTSYNYLINAIAPIAVSGIMTGAWGDSGNTFHRRFNTSDTVIWFDSGVYGGSLDNTAVVPFQIYGIKGVT